MKDMPQVAKNETSSTEVVADIVNRWINTHLHNSAVSQNTAAMNLVNEAKPVLIAALVEAFDRNRKGNPQ